MSQDRIEIVREAIAAFNRRDLEAMFKHYDPEIEYHDAGDLPGGGVHHGLDAVRQHVEGYLDAWAETSVEVDEIDLVGEQVLARIRYVGVGRTTGIEVETPPFFAVYDFRAERVLRVRQFATHADALRALGLST